MEKDCRNHLAFMAWQRDRYIEEIDYTKWVLSFHAHRDVGLQVATREFLSRYFACCAVGWRKHFCGSLCDYRHGCELGLEKIQKDEGRGE